MTELSMDVQMELITIIEKIITFQEQYHKSIEEVQKHQDPVIQSKMYFSIMNDYKNKVKPELNNADKILIKGWQNHPLHKTDPERNLERVFKEYRNSVQKYNTEDNKLKKK